jgi:hypothetical protein
MANPTPIPQAVGAAAVPATPTDEAIQKVVFAVLRRWKDDRAWDKYTREVGPYDVTILRPEVLEIIRAVLTAFPSPASTSAPAEPLCADCSSTAERCHRPCRAPDAAPVGKRTMVIANDSRRGGEPQRIAITLPLATPTGVAGVGSEASSLRRFPSETTADESTSAAAQEGEQRKLWLWRNFVDGRPEYWAFDHPFPRNLHDGDPQTLGEPCGYALLKPCRPGRSDWTEESVLRAIARASERTSAAPDERAAFEVWAAHEERLNLTMRESNGHRIYADERTLAAWGAWQVRAAASPSGERTSAPAPEGEK